MFNVVQCTTSNEKGKPKSQGTHIIEFYSVRAEDSEESGMEAEGRI